MPKKQNKTDHLAVVDIGSNSVRLVVYRVSAGRHEAVFDKKATCRLAMGMKPRNPCLNPKGMKATLKTLKNFKKLIKKYKVAKVVAIGTAAMRAVEQTKKGKAFHRKAEKALGSAIKVISGLEEARLTAIGVMSSMPRAKGICGDLGGGSLELASINNKKIRHTTTTALGTLTLLTETKGDALKTEVITRQRLEKVDWLRKAKGQTFYAIGGSWRAVGRMMMQSIGVSPRHVHGFTIKAARAKSVAVDIALKNPDVFRSLQPKISKRADIIPVAAAALVKLIDIIQPKNLVFSGHGIREGIVCRETGEA